MANTHIREINDLNFETEVLQSDRPFLLAFSGAWCAPCRQLTPILERIAAANQGRLHVGKLDADESPAVAVQWSVRAVPTLIVFRNGKEFARRLGFTHEANILKLVGDLDRQPWGAEDLSLYAAAD